MVSNEEEALECLRILTSFAKEGALDDPAYVAALNRLNGWLTELAAAEYKFPFLSKADLARAWLKTVLAFSDENAPDDPQYAAAAHDLGHWLRVLAARAHAFSNLGLSPE